MKLKWNPDQILDRVIVGSLGLLIIAVAVLLIMSVTRQSGLEDELQGSIDDLQETTTDLEETVDELRASTNDPEVLTDLDNIDNRLQQVGEQLEYLEDNIDEPLFDEGSSINADAPSEVNSDSQEAQQEFDNAFTTFAWVIGILSIVTSIVLAVVLGKRHSKRRNRLLAMIGMDQKTM